MYGIHRARASAGFSFIEIIIAITIVAIMAAGYLGMTSYIARAQRQRTEGSLGAIQIAITQYENDTGKVPSTLADLTQRPADQVTSKRWKGSYIDAKDIEGDAWHKPYVYQSTPGAEHPYILYSWGSKKGDATPENDWIDVWKI
jgi:general secretion pathway protein G